MTKINSRILISGADHFVVEELNPYENVDFQPDREKAIKEHSHLRQVFESAGIEVEQVKPPDNCQDGIYTANWGLVWRNKAVLSRLPNRRQPEEPYARETLVNLGYEPITPSFRFSGQGDALPCGNYLFCGSHYRSDPEIHEFLANVFECEVIGLKTIPAKDIAGEDLINKITGWPDSYFYDLDLALSVINSELIAWCPDAFLPESRRKIEALPIQKLTVSYDEATKGFACNLLSTGDKVIMSNRAPELKSKIENLGIETLTPEINELSKGGGYIRCCSLTLG